MTVINRNALTWYLILAFALAWILFILPVPFGAPNSSLRQSISLVSWSLAMWAPGLAAILVTRYVKKEKIESLNLRQLGDRKAYLWAWLLPALLVVIAGLLTWLLGAGTLDLSFSAIREAMAQAPGADLVPPTVVVVIQILFSLTLAPLINTFLALGEELGWRGFLLPELLPLGQWRAILLSGVIWGFWHAPTILQGHNYPNNPVLGVLLMVVFSVLVGAFFSWIYLRTRSPWAPARAHGSLNATAGLPLLFLTGVNMTIGGTLASLIGWIPLALLVGWLIWSRRLPVDLEETSSQAGSDARTHAEVSRETY
jgi:membrane protease YdiL (CAAX protease family)